MFIYIIMLYMMLLILGLMIIFLFILLNKLVFFIEFNMLKFMSIKFEMLFLFDWISVLFILVVLMISLMVIFYSMEYMSGDLKFNQFILLVLMFILSMLLMILSPNLISILLGWDGLGLVSYCLVIYYQSKNSFNSGMVTVLINRLGDVLILISIGLMISLGSWNYMFMEKLSELIFIMIMIASFTKSAQIPFSSWLPLAMAAPTPVSSLVHSSTLVTAGIYLMIRLNYLMVNKKIMNLMMLVSVMTMFLSGMGANFEFDLKKIIALSTLSQLGIMLFCLSMKLDEVSLFHLLTHAMFKSMLFMCAGVIIHNMLGNQDIRFISMILYNMPMVSMLFNCSTLSLCGIPFMSGFFSKDLILEMYLMSSFNKFILIILFMSMGLTVMYSIRLIYYSFIKFPQLTIYMNYTSMISLMGISMYLLFMFSIIKGLILSWILFSMKNMIYLTIKLKMMIYFYMILGGGLGLMLLKIFPKMMFLFYVNNYVKFFLMLWFMPLLYGSWIFLILNFSNKLIYYMEMGWIEYFLGGNIMGGVKKIFKTDILLKNYFFLMIIFLMILLSFMF